MIVSMAIKIWIFLQDDYIKPLRHENDCDPQWRTVQ